MLNRAACVASLRPYVCGKFMMIRINDRKPEGTRLARLFMVRNPFFNLIVVLVVIEEHH